jgi:ABC-type Fe3+-hydroxamate transport system substrate-binding protein
MNPTPVSLVSHACPPPHCARTPRIASLVPSLTETVVTLGLGDCLVARTGFCIHPAQALRDVPKVGGTKDVNLRKLRHLMPTHVLVNVDENRLDCIEAIRAWPQPPQIVVTHPLAPDDNLALVSQMCEHFRAYPGVVAHADALLQALHRELDLVARVACPTQTVLYLIWREPWMTVARDTYLSRMLERIGWATLPDAVGGPSGAARYPVVHGHEPWLGDVQRVLLSSEPYRFGAQHADEARRLCPYAMVQSVDGELLSWYGARAVPGLRYLRELAAAPAG